MAGVAKWCCCCKLRQLERNVGEKERKIDERGEERKKVQRKTNCEEKSGEKTNRIGALVVKGIEMPRRDGC